MIISFDQSFKSKAALRDILGFWNSDREHFTLLTSGTSGQPKRVSLSRSQLYWSVKQHVNCFNLQDESMLIVLPIDKAGGFMQIIRSLVQGWNIHLNKAHTNPFSSRIPTDCSLCSITPQQLYHALESEEVLASFKMVLIGGAAIPLQTLSRAKAFQNKYTDCQLVETYGMTETASHIAYRKLGDEWFTPLDGVNLSLNNDCLNIDIPALEFTFQTNDVAELNANTFRILGRKDLMINSGGVKIHPEQIEILISGLLQEMGIKRRFYLGKEPHPELGEQAILYLEGEPIKDQAFLLEMLKRELPAYHHPKKLKYVANFNYTATGKLLRK